MPPQSTPTGVRVRRQARLVPEHAQGATREDALPEPLQAVLDGWRQPAVRGVAVRDERIEGQAAAWTQTSRMCNGTLNHPSRALQGSGCASRLATINYTEVWSTVLRQAPDSVWRFSTSALKRSRSLLT